jgi:hypothetical protein
VSAEDLRHLVELRAWLARSVAHVFREACGVMEPAGSSPGWDQTRAWLGVAPLGDAERAEVRAAQRPLGGAAVMEVAAACTAVVRQARLSLGRVREGVVPEVDTQLAHLRALLERTERELLEAYKRVVLPARRGMFANALASHDAGAPKWGATAHALGCRNCGAPRLSDRDFECAYCGQRMVEAR